MLVEMGLQQQYVPQDPTVAGREGFFHLPAGRTASRGRRSPVEGSQASN